MEMEAHHERTLAEQASLLASSAAAFPAGILSQDPQQIGKQLDLAHPGSLQGNAAYSQVHASGAVGPTSVYQDSDGLAGLPGLVSGSTKIPGALNIPEYLKASCLYGVREETAQALRSSLDRLEIRLKVNKNTALRRDRYLRNIRESLKRLDNHVVEADVAVFPEVNGSLGTKGSIFVIVRLPTQELHSADSAAKYFNDWSLTRCGNKSAGKRTQLLDKYVKPVVEWCLGDRPGIMEQFARDKNTLAEYPLNFLFFRGPSGQSSNSGEVGYGQGIPADPSQSIALDDHESDKTTTAQLPGLASYVLESTRNRISANTKQPVPAPGSLGMHVPDYGQPLHTPLDRRTHLVEDSFSTVSPGFTASGHLLSLALAAGEEQAAGSRKPNQTGTPSVASIHQDDGRSTLHELISLLSLAARCGWAEAQLSRQRLPNPGFKTTVIPMDPAHPHKNSPIGSIVWISGGLACLATDAAARRDFGSRISFCVARLVAQPVSAHSSSIDVVMAGTLRVPLEQAGTLAQSLSMESRLIREGGSKSSIYVITESGLETMQDTASDDNAGPSEEGDEDSKKKLLAFCDEQGRLAFIESSPSRMRRRYPGKLLGTVVAVESGSVDVVVDNGWIEKVVGLAAQDSSAVVHSAFIHAPLSDTETLNRLREHVGDGQDDGEHYPGMPGADGRKRRRLVRKPGE